MPDVHEPMGRGAALAPAQSVGETAIGRKLSCHSEISTTEMAVRLDLIQAPTAFKPGAMIAADGDPLRPRHLDDRGLGVPVEDSRGRTATSPVAAAARRCDRRARLAARRARRYYRGA